jgi:hypothetical protein
MGDAWFIGGPDAERGPFTAAEVKAMASEGRLGRSTPIRHRIDVSWKPLELSALFNVLPDRKIVYRKTARAWVNDAIVWSFWSFCAYSTIRMLWHVGSLSLALWTAGVVAFLALFIWSLGPQQRAS